MNKPENKPEACPNCGANEIVEIVYGYPAPDLLESASKGLIKLGGCAISKEAPKWHCNSCLHEWL